MKKVFATILTGVLTIGLLAGCSTEGNKEPESTTEAQSTSLQEQTTPAADGKVVELKLYQFQAGIVDQVQEICDEFNATHTNIKVVPDRPGDDYFNVLKTMFTTGRGPDIFSINAWTMVEDYANSGIALDLSNEAFVANVPEESLTSVSVGGKVYALPMESAAIGVLYNQKIFKDNGIAVPTTVSELKAVCEKLKAANVTPFMTPVKETWMLRHIWSALHSPSVDVVEFAKSMNTGTSGFQNEKTDGIFQTLDIIGAYSQENPYDYDYNTGCADFGLGKAAMYVTGLWALDMIKQMDPEIQLGMFALPISDNAEDTKLSVDNNSVYCINANSENVEAAKTFLNWLAEKQNAASYASKTKTIPVIKDVEAFTGADPAVIDVISYLEQGKTCPWGFSIWPTGFDDEVGAIIQTYLSGDLTKEKALEDMNSTWAEFKDK